VNNRFNNLSGQTFGSLTVITTSLDPAVTGKSKGSYSYCYCSKYKCYGWVRSADLTFGKTRTGSHFNNRLLPANLIVDEDLIETLSSFKWCLSLEYYTACIESKYIRLNRYIWFIKTGEELNESIYIDHIDRNKNNNKFSNLRKATPQQNSLNQTKIKTFKGEPTSSKYLGVFFRKDRQKWLWSIRVDGVRKRSKPFNSEEEAYADKLRYIETTCTETDKQFRTI
jgi:hypothetical protein